MDSRHQTEIHERPQAKAKERTLDHVGVHDIGFHPANQPSQPGKGLDQDVRLSFLAEGEMTNAMGSEDRVEVATGATNMHFMAQGRLSAR